MRATTTRVTPIETARRPGPARQIRVRPQALPLDDVLVGREAVDARVVALADLAADHGEEQRHDDRGRARDGAAGGERVVAAPDARQVEALEDVVLAAADRGEARDDDRREDRPEP